jgi:hypothetical protein
MRTINRIWPVLLAATFVTAVWMTPASAADQPATTAAQQTPAKAAKANPVPAQARHAKLATTLPHPRPAVVRLASRFYGPAIGYYFPLYLGVAY